MALVNGELVPIDPAEEATILAQRAETHLQLLQNDIIERAQKRLDDFAKTRGYDGILSLCSYVSSPTPKFAAEGSYGIVIRDATWAKLYEILAEVTGGARQPPANFEEIELELPILLWPE